MFNFKKQKKLKEQRDRFLACAFASADLFIEIDTDGTVVYATGAVKSLTGIDHKTLIGKKWLTIFEPKHHSLLMELKKTAMPGIRQGPLLIELNKTMGGRKGIFTSIRLPNNKNFYITMGLSNALLNDLSQLMEEHDDGPMLTGFLARDLPKDEPLTTNFAPEDTDTTPMETGFVAEDLKKEEGMTTGFKADDISEEALETGFKAGDIEEPKAMTTGFTAEDNNEESMTTGFVASDDDTPEAMTTGFVADSIGLDDTLEERSEFQSEAKRVFHYAQRNNLSASMTVFDFGNTEALPEEVWPDIIGRITEMMRHESLADCPASQIKPNTYSLLHDSDRKIEKFKERIIKMSKELDPNGEGIEVTTRTIDANLNEMTIDKSVRALMHTIQAIQDNKDEEIETSLAKNMKKLVTSNTDKLNEFKAIIERVDFNINFQPVVKTINGEADHYEVLCRVNNGDIGDWVMFGEDNGLAPEFDLAVLERTMNYIHFKAGTTRTRFSINISHKSIEDPKFAEKFHDQLSRRDLSKRILIEINNPRSVTDPSHLNSFIASLNDLDYLVTLDQIVFEESLPTLLEGIDVAYIKTNSKLLKRLYDDPENKKIVEDVLAICKKQDIRTVAQFVEKQEQVDFLNQIGIPCAQGYLFGHAEPAPKFIPPTR